MFMKGNSLTALLMAMPPFDVMYNALLKLRKRAAGNSVDV